VLRNIIITDHKRMTPCNLKKKIHDFKKKFCMTADHVKINWTLCLKCSWNIMCFGRRSHCISAFDNNNKIFKKLQTNLMYICTYKGIINIIYFIYIYLKHYWQIAFHVYYHFICIDNEMIFQLFLINNYSIHWYCRASKKN
jgi:hypothetical protein